MAKVEFVDAAGKSVCIAFEMSILPARGDTVKTGDKFYKVKDVYLDLDEPNKRYKAMLADKITKATAL
jgi:hypothetical protein